MSNPITAPSTTVPVATFIDLLMPDRQVREADELVVAGRLD